MSYSTIPAWQAYAKPGEKMSREHPVFDFAVAHQEAFDDGSMKKLPFTDYHTEDFVFTKTDGTVLPPGEASWKGFLESYGPFGSHFHEAKYACIYERDENWEMVGFATVYGNLLAPGEKTKTDSFGGQWDVAMPGAFLFVFVKDPSAPKGYRVKSMTVFGDGVPVVSEMMKRGMVKPEDLSK